MRNFVSLSGSGIQLTIQPTVKVAQSQIFSATPVTIRAVRNLSFKAFKDHTAAEDATFILAVSACCIAIEASSTSLDLERFEALLTRTNQLIHPLGIVTDLPLCIVWWFSHK
jgi:hypothetical protein